MKRLPTFLRNCNLVYRFGTVEREVKDPCLASNSVAHAAALVCVVVLFVEVLNNICFL